ncbi:hypothetical protein EET67_05215 [Pseudaminobacter arsenicus]|uniref:DUF2163 domain-containing protein n=1 Tax=Borborobacter arsenicus TaxID=1851146 RepID=A0A432VA32_9HYPH|nr:hypothetical protein [Pseudaminobacter arsenicus]RUM99039.1 hypothetical protein EET67_05215 [Pseudaminobacter arsenicus]
MAFFTSDQIAALSASTVRVDFLTKMEFKSGTSYLWNGNTDLMTGGQTWKPMHGAGVIDGLSAPTGTAAEAVTFQLNGLPDQATDLLRMALEDNQDSAQRLVTVYLQLFDADWQAAGAPIGIWWGFMQPPRITRTPMQGTEGAIQSISMQAENAFFNRSRPPYGRYTDRDQQKRSPGDKFFQFTPSLLFKSFTYPDY